MQKRHKNIPRYLILLHCHHIQYPNGTGTFIATAHRFLKGHSHSRYLILSVPRVDFLPKTTRILENETRPRGCQNVLPQPPLISAFFARQQKQNDNVQRAKIILDKYKIFSFPTLALPHLPVLLTSFFFKSIFYHQLQYLSHFFKVFSIPRYLVSKSI